MRVWVGTSGYIYDWWKGVFYPPELPQSKWFEYYQKTFDTVELNVTFYRLPQEKAFEGWRKKAKRGFLFSLKGSRFITHVKRLKDVLDSVSLFMKRAQILGEHLGPILWQLPPGMKCDLKRLEEFLKILKDTSHPFHVVELRNRDWVRDEIFDLVEHYGFSVCLSDHPECPVERWKKAPFLYIRRHGKGVLYGGYYTKKDISKDAELVKGFKGKEVFIYFNNDQNGYAVLNASEFKSAMESIACP